MNLQKIQHTTVRSLGSIKDNHTVDLLIQALDEPMGTYAAMALIEIGKPAVEPLIQILEENDYQARGLAVKVLGHIGDARAVDSLIHALKDNDDGVRSSAAMALGDIGDKRAVEPLILVLEDNDSEVRKSAASALKLINASSKAMPEPAESQINSKINKSRLVLEKAALAIESGDKAGLIETVSNDTLSRVKGEPDLSSPEALMIANGMKEAKFIEMAGDTIIYEMAIGNATYSLETIEEGGVWKILGF